MITAAKIKINFIYLVFICSSQIKAIKDTTPFAPMHAPRAKPVI
jgi:hypothetical protein